MTETTIKLLNNSGLHARPANDFVKLAKEFDSNILVKKDNMKVNGKSIIHILTLGASYGSTITIEAEGEDEKEAIHALKDLVEKGFDE